MIDYFVRMVWVVFLVVTPELYSFAQSTPKPSQQQLQWQQLETTAFLHFTVNTFTGKEWGEGTESPSIFNPQKLDARQWVKALKEAGFKMAIITAKHHDGFCLWPSKYTEHTVKNSPWKNGKGDVVKEVADACKEYGVKFGFYLSPWDRHEKTYGTAAYNDFYLNQLKELLTNYGEVSEVWFDGAKGENEKDMQYDFNAYWKMVKALQPKAIIFSAIGPDVRWVGNETGNAGEVCWSTINTEGMWPGKADNKYLNTGDPNGTQWIPAETDVSIRPGWFYRASENRSVRSPQNLVNLYYQSVGRNSLLLLNIPPNSDGLLEETDIKAIQNFRSILDETFASNQLLTRKYKNLTDKKTETYIVMRPGIPLEITLESAARFDRIALQENIRNGQFIESGVIEYWDGNEWQPIQQFTTVGYKKLMRFKEVMASKVRITFIAAKGAKKVQLSEMGLYKASSLE